MDKTLEGCSPIVINGRILRLKSNGVKRVVEEMLRVLPEVDSILPADAWSSGVRGHAWEQFVLPRIVGGAPLWSPSTSGPVSYKNQIVTIHDLAFWDVPECFSPQFAAWYRWMTGRLAKTARHLVTVSQFTADRVMQQYAVSAERLTVIPLGVSKEFYARSGEEVGACLSRYGLQQQDYVVGFAGNDRRKNTVGLIQAWELSGLAEQGAKLVLFGRAGNAAVFGTRARIHEVPGVLRVGGVSDEELACLFSAARGFVFPSFYEGFGLPVIEAASCGCRILTSNCSSLPEVAPKDALLVNPKDIAAISDGIGWLLRASDDDVGKANRAGEMARFSWDSAAVAYRSVFENWFV